MKKPLLIAGAAVAALVAAVVIWQLTRPAPPPPKPVVEVPKGPDPAHLAKIAELVRQAEELEAKGRYNDAINVLKQLAALEPSDPRPAAMRPRLEEKRRRLEAWTGALAKAEAERAEALRRNTPADWQRLIEAAGSAEKIADSEEERAKTRALVALAKQYLDWGLAREEEKKGKLDAALELAARAVEAAEPPADLKTYQAALQRKKRKQDFDRAAYAARAEGSPAKAYELWQKARPLAEEPKDVEEADGRLHALKIWVDPAERERRYAEALKAGDAAFEAGQLDVAEKAYKDAQGLKVTEAKPAQGIARVTAARNAKAVEAHLAAAREAEGKRAWADAIEATAKALRLKPDAALAAKLKGLEETHRPAKIQIVLDEATGVRLDFVLVKRGTFLMGDPQGGSDEKPRDVEVAKDFWMQTTETTQAQWRVVMNTQPWLSASVPLLPVEGVTWDDVQKYLEKLNALASEQLKGRRAALPTEAEWEYACRAGSKTRWSFGDSETAFDLHGWQASTSLKAPQPVAKKQANAWGLFDLHGNVAEWCADEAGRTADDAPALRVVRGGSWNDKASNCRSAKRDRAAPTTSNAFVGFRLILRPAP
jgi:formylglycine-generating enzyme required for sulfatase activity